MLRRRTATTFTISFLDVMCCGFGVMVLLFLVIKHNPATSATSRIKSSELSGEVNLLEKEILEGRNGLAELRNINAELDKRIVTAQGLARQITDELNDTSGQERASASADQNSEIEQLKQDLKKLEEDRKRQEADTQNTGDNIRSFIGEGNRQYLTGLKMGGDRILILLDASASMLDYTIVNVIRRRNMSDQTRRESPKWVQAQKIVEWLSTRFPATSKYQIYTFNTKADPVIANTKGQWLDVSNKEQFGQTFKNIQTIIPEGGTSLENVFRDIRQLSPLPDNIYLLTDGLPTQGRTPSGNTTISGRNRLELFEDAIKQLPGNIPINTIILPMEGDPMASGMFWKLAQVSGGSYMSPSGDWP